MKAIVITQPGGPGVLQLQERPVPEPGADEVLIRVKAAGVNRPDLAQRKGHYPAPSGAPADVPGLEVAGIVDRCGRNVTRWKNGDEVCALLAGGGYADYAVAHEGHCLPLPQTLTFEEAASLPETFFTVWHNVFQRGKLQPGENLLVHGGSSGIGVAAIQIATALGAKVYTTAGSAAKCDACVQLGAVMSVNYKTNDFEDALKDIGMDVVLDMVGGDYFEKNLRLLNEEGRLVFINAMKGSQSSISIIEVMRRRLTITGSTLRNREAAFKADVAKEVEHHVWPLLAAGKVKPVVYKVFPLEKAYAAHELMEASQHIGKLVLLC